MKTYAEKPQQNQRHTNAQEHAQQPSCADAEFQFVDNRADDISSPRQLQAMVNSSPRMAAQRKQTSHINGTPVPLKGKVEPVQSVEEEELLQGKFAAESPAQLAQQPDAKPNNTGLPDNLKLGIENLSGMSMDNVKVHYNSNKPIQLQACAYAQGTDIHIASGQEKYLPHEAWHVVQQKQNRAKPTIQMKSKTDVSHDDELEKTMQKHTGSHVLREYHPIHPGQFKTLQLKPVKEKENDTRNYKDDIKTDFKLIKEQAFEDEEYQIRDQLQHVWWKTPDYFTAKKSEEEDKLNVDNFLKTKELGSWVESYKEISKAIDVEKKGQNRKELIDSLSMHLLQKFMVNAVFTSEEIALQEYQASPLNYQDDGGYLRSFASSFVKVLQSQLPGKYGTKELFLSRSLNFRSVLPQYFNVVNFTQKTDVTKVDIANRLASTIDRVADFAVKNSGLDKYLDVEGNFIDFVDFTDILSKEVKDTEIKKLNAEYGKLVYETVLEKAKPKIVDAYIKKHFALVDVQDRDALAVQVNKELTLKGSGDFSLFTGKLAGEKSVAFGEFKQQEEKKFKDLSTSQTTPENEDEQQWAKYGAQMDLFERWLRKDYVDKGGKGYNIKGNCKYKGANDEGVAKQFLKSSNDEERKALFTKITREQNSMFSDFLKGKEAEYKDMTPDQYIQSEMEGLQTLVDSTERGLPTVIMTGGMITADPNGYNQSGLLVSDGTMAPAILTALNKSGYVPSPTMANRKMLTQGVDLKTITSEVIKLQRQSKAKQPQTKEKLKEILATVNSFNPESYTSIITAQNQLQRTNTALEAFKTLANSEYEHAKILAPVITKLMTSLKILDDESTYPALALAEIEMNMKAAVANSDNIVKFVRNIQNLHEQVILALESNKDPAPDTSTLNVPKDDTYFQGANFTDYGLKAFSVAYQAARAQHGDGQFNIDAYYNIYFELTQKLHYSQGASGGDVVLQQPKTLNDFKDRWSNPINDIQFKNPHLVMIDVHPNDASRKEMHMQEVKKLLVWLFDGEPEDYRCTVIVDITLNYITDDDIKWIKFWADEYISAGQCNLVFIQSLTKFAQTGMDKHSGGLMFHYNDPEKWGKFNSSVKKAVAEDPMDVTVQKYFHALFTQTENEQKQYLKKVRGNTKYVYEQLQAQFAKLKVKGDAIEIAESDDPGSCYVAFHYDKFAASVFDTEITSDSVHKMNVDILNDALMKIMKQVKLPMSMRQSFGFPISNFGDTGEAIRLTIGIETQQMLDDYIKVITYVNGKLRGKIKEDEGSETLKDPKKRQQFLTEITTDINKMEDLQTKLDLMLNV